MFCCVLMAIQVTPLINQTLKMCLRQFWSRHQEAKANSASLAEFFFPLRTRQTSVTVVELNSLSLKLADGNLLLPGLARLPGWVQRCAFDGAGVFNSTFSSVRFAAVSVRGSLDAFVVFFFLETAVRTSARVLLSLLFWVCWDKKQRNMRNNVKCI